MRVEIRIYGKRKGAGSPIRLRSARLDKELFKEYEYLLIKYADSVPESVLETLRISDKRKETLRKPRVFAQLRLELVPDELYKKIVGGSELERELMEMGLGERAMYLSYYEKVFAANLKEGATKNRQATYTSNRRTVKRSAPGFKTIPGKGTTYFLHPGAARRVKAFAEALAERMGARVMLLRAVSKPLAEKVYQDYHPLTQVSADAKNFFMAKVLETS